MNQNTVWLLLTQWAIMPFCPPYNRTTANLLARSPENYPPHPRFTMRFWHTPNGHYQRMNIPQDYWPLFSYFFPSLIEDSADGLRDELHFLILLHCLSHCYSLPLLVHWRVKRCSCGSIAIASDFWAPRGDRPLTYGEAFIRHHYWPNHASLTALCAYG